jgi:hypothetical protein
LRTGAVGTAVQSGHISMDGVNSERFETQRTSLVESFEVSVVACTAPAMVPDDAQVLMEAVIVSALALKLPLDADSD